MKCSVPVCDRPAKRHGMCSAHFGRWQRKSSRLLEPISSKAPRNSALPFLRKHSCSKSRRCIPWPYGTFDGYGVLGHDGTTMLASRVMCILAHGAPPNKRSHAAHSCGNPICVNPNHIRWATPAENAKDRALHGTEARGSNRPNAKLDNRKVRSVIRMTKAGHSQKDIAAKFGVSRALIYGVQKGHRWKA